MKLPIYIPVGLSAGFGLVVGFVFGLLFGNHILLFGFAGATIATAGSLVTIYSTTRVKQVRQPAVEPQYSSLLPPQIDSVFLFNTLHNVSALLHLNPDKAARTVEQLATLIRAMAEMNLSNFTLLNEEFRVAELYLQIEQARFGERLKIRKSIDALCLELQVPCFILLPLVENCIRHGIEVFDQNVEVILSASFKNNNAIIAVSDTGRGLGTKDVESFISSTSGIGKVKKNLKAFFGPDVNLSIESLAPSGTRVSIVFPIVDNYE